ncbi:LuxR C-terminal-related transcriptional regulator [Lentzea sp. CA-135723]|uniref:helix-turn-helix transcriptional regulator n=1 Tax=Lentzea sp. CA-135723 TaxID=3239950 RepID=UPI003D8BAA23
MTGLDVIAAALRSGTGSLVVLRGPLGCGRSAVLKDARQLADGLGLPVLRAVGARREKDFPFGVVHQLTGGADALPAGPALVTVDDLQWADDESLRVLARSAGRVPAVLVVCVRDGDVGADSPLVAEVVRQAAHVVALRPARLDESARPKIVACLRAQPPPTRAVLDALAVLGEDAHAGLLAPLAEVDEVGCATALRAMDRLGLVDRWSFLFAHDVVRDAVEATMAPADRVRLQANAVRLLHDAGAPAEVVAGRLLAITSVQGWWAVEVLRLAAAMAVRRGAPVVAVEYLRRALLEQPEAGWRRAALLVDLATAERGVDRAAAVAHLSVAARMVPGPRERAAIVARFVPGALAEAPAGVRELVEEVEGELTAAPHDEDLALRVEARSHHAECLAPRRSARCVDRLRDRTVPSTAAGRELRAVRLHCATVGAVWRAHDVAAQALRVLAESPAAPEHVHTPIATLVTTLCAAGAGDSALGWLDSAWERAGAERVLVEAEQVSVLLHAGRITSARSVAESVLTAVGTGGVATEARVALAALACETQDDQLVHRLLRLFDGRAHTPASSVAHRMLCGAAGVAAVDLRASLASFLDAGSQARDLGWHNPVLFPWRTEAARVLWRLGDVTRARDLAAEQHALAVRWGSATGIGKALCHLGSMTGGQAGVAMLRQAVQVLEGTGNRFELARALWQLGRRTADRRRDDGPALTGTQQRVVELALAGRSNQEIAEHLRVGVRVVEKHLTNAYRKLGVQGRGGLSTALSHLR